MNKTNTKHPFILLLVTCTLLLSSFILITSPPPGLTNAEAIGPFINNNLPNQQPDGDIEATPIYTNIDWLSPIVATPFPGTNNMLIVEMDGRFFTVSSNENTSNRTTVLDIQDRTWYYNWSTNNNNTKHGGIQNVVFHPEFGMNQGKDYIYVYYIHNETNDAPNGPEPYYVRLSRFTWNGSSFNPNSELVMINQFDTRKGHDGSGMFFGTDGFLYVAVGDEGNSAPVAQQIDYRYRCGVWRLDVDQQGGNVSHPIIRQPSNDNVPAGFTASYTQGYYIPNDNPWVNPNGSVLEEYYAHGLRQPFRMTQDAATGNIWIGDVGAGSIEEVNLLDEPGLNFQWDYKEGFNNGRATTPNPIIGKEREPVLALPHTDGWSAIIGGYVYKGTAIPQLSGKYIYANNGTNGNIYALTHTAGNVADDVELIATKPDAGGTFTGIGSFGIDHSNELLVLKLGTATGEGKIYKLTENVPDANLVFPDKLSQTGIFSNLQNLTPVAGIIPYDVNTPLWSAGTNKKRWVALPNDGNVNTNVERIGYNENAPWSFPVGTVFIKHFEQPDGKKLETRVWMHGVDGNWFGTTYQWNNAGTDADLLLAGAEENITIDGETFPYLYPSVTQCKTCHLPSSGDVLGFRTHQLNRDILYPTTGLMGNQLETFAELGFIPSVNTNTVITSYALSDNSQSLEVRARSYFDSNCAHCHNPDSGNRAAFDTRYTTNFNNQNLLTANLIDNFGIAGAQVIAPQNLDNSILYQRMNTTEGCCAMPPLAKGRIDVEGVQLVANWINSLGADCSSSSTINLGNTLSDGNFIDGHNPAILINENDTYTNTSGSMEEVCIVAFNFYARRLGNPVTPFIAKVNGDNNFTILTVGQSRTSAQYKVGNNAFPFSNHSDDVVMLAPGETIATGFMDALPTSPDSKIQSVIPAQQAASEDEVWQSYTASSTTNPALFPTLTVGKSPGLGTAGPATHLRRSYKFNIGIEVGEGQEPVNGDCSENLALGGTATQSSTWANNNSQYGAANGIDGNLNGNHTASSLTHTLFEDNPWWEIDLGDVYQLSAVKLWNRTNCCAERLTDFYVLVSDAPFNSQALNTTINQNGVGDFHFPGTAGRETDINLNRTGRYLRVQLSGNNALQLAEVEIFGCEVTVPSGCTTVAIPARIQAEDYCDQSGVQAEPTGDVGGGENIGFIATGDWMEYEIQVPTTGTYQVNYRVAAAGSSGGVIQLQLNGNNVGSIAIPSTGAWQTYTTVSNEVNLTQGTYTLRVFAQQAGWNLNWFEFETINTPTPTPADSECASGASNLLVNGSFEETSNPAYATADALIEALGRTNSGVKFIDKHPDTDFPGWFTTGGIFNPDNGVTSTGGTLELGQSGFLGVPAPDGEVFAEMDGNHHNQIITITPGQVLDWEVTHRGRPGTDMISIAAGPVGNTSVIATASSPNTQWITHKGQYQVPNGVTQIQFTITPTGAANDDLDSSNLLDDVKVCPSDDPPSSSGCDLIAVIPVRIQAEDFCDQSGVQAEPTGDVGGGENIGYIQVGDWMEYEIMVTTPGTYAVDYRVAANNASGGVIQLQIDGNSIGNMSIPSTGAWQTYTTVSNSVTLPQGIHTLRVFAQQAGWNLNWFEFYNWEDTPENPTNPSNSTTTESCDEGTSITYGNGTITMEGGSYYQVLDANWQEVFNCGWQCGNSQTVNNLASGDYRVYIKNDGYQNICEKVITLSAGSTNGGGSDPVEEEQEEENGGGTTGNNATCGEVAVTYGNGEIAVIGLPNKDYFFKVNDLDNGWADVGNCGWNCGNEFKAENLSNGLYLLTVYNADWSPHCDTEITMTGSSITANATDRQAPHLSFAAYPANRIIDLQWLSNSGFKVGNYEVEHSEDGINFEQLAKFVNKDWSTETAYHQTTDETPLMGTNYYRVKEIYLDGSFAYTDVQQVNFQIDLDKVSIFPNPARDELFLNLNPHAGKKASLFLFNLLGNQLLQQDIATVTTDFISINTSEIQNGLYYLIIEVEEQKTFAQQVLIHRLY